MFQEGMAQDYERARFAEFRVDAPGHTLLVALLDEDRKRIGAENQ